MTSGGAIIRAVVIGNTLICEGMRSLLTGPRYDIGHECSTVAIALQLSSYPVDLVIAAMFIDATAVAPIRLLRSAFQQSRIVLYPLGIHVSHHQLLELWSSIDGCLTPDAPKPVLKQSLELIMMGGHVFPLSSVLDPLPSRELQSQLFELSDRERQVIGGLCEGKSNKKIAQELDVSESTVKAHLRTLMRKIGVQNRTEAAIWAARQKLMAPSPGPAGLLEFSEAAPSSQTS